MSKPFSKVLAKYYEKWYRDCQDSVILCEKIGDFAKANDYKKAATEYFEMINAHWQEIEFYRIGDNAFYTESATKQAWDKFFGGAK